MIHSRLLRYACVALVVLFFSFLPSPASAVAVRRHVQAPRDVNKPGAPCLDSITSYSTYQIFSHNFDIPYDTFESMIKGKLAEIVPSTISGTE